MFEVDSDMAAFIHGAVRKHGVKLALGHIVEGFEEKDNGVDVLLREGAPLHGDLAVLAIGVTPDTHLAREAGLELGMNGSIVVNDRMETSVPDIYAAGNAVQVKHYVAGEDAIISLAGPANKQGRIIADNICGGDSRYPCRIKGHTAEGTGSCLCAALFFRKRSGEYGRFMLFVRAGCAVTLLPVFRRGTDMKPTIFPAVSGSTTQW